MYISTYKSTSRKGYTLLFAIIVSSIILSIAAFILSISRKQFILSSSARDSTVAIYAAESGIQCAVDSFYKGTLATTSGLAIIACNQWTYTGVYDLNATPDADMNLAQGPQVTDGSDYKVEKAAPITVILPGSPSPTCVIVNITQGYSNVAPYPHKVIIDSRGYNLGNRAPCVAGGLTNARAVERAIRLIYYN